VPRSGEFISSSSHSDRNGPFHLTAQQRCSCRPYRPFPKCSLATTFAPKQASDRENNCLNIRELSSAVDGRAADLLVGRALADFGQRAAPIAGTAKIRATISVSSPRTLSEAIPILSGVHGGHYGSPADVVRRPQLPTPSVGRDGVAVPTSSARSNTRCSASSRWQPSSLPFMKRYTSRRWIRTICWRWLGSGNEATVSRNIGGDLASALVRSRQDLRDCRSVTTFLPACYWRSSAS